MFGYDTSWRKHKHKIYILIFGGYCMNKTKNFLFEVKGFLDATFEKLKNISLEKKICMSRILYFFFTAFVTALCNVTFSMFPH